MESEGIWKPVRRKDLLTAINPELNLIPEWMLPAVDEELEHHELLQAIKMYCLERGWSISFDYFPSAEPEEPYVVDCELTMPLPKIGDEEPQAQMLGTDSNASATTAALCLLATAATNFFDEGEEVTNS